MSGGQLGLREIRDREERNNSSCLEVLEIGGSHDREHKERKERSP